jgi:hypothetical protein
MKTLLIDREAFCDWYFDHDICKDFFYNHKILDSLITNGVFKIDAQQLLDSCGYLPFHVVAEGQEPILDDGEEVEMSAYDTITFATPTGN